ncbi:MAG TPA: diaminobutyrate acetyltransferase, partial [Alcanivorax sp.]|nr:diaminobutyrate acetyltransferase [Alcanivorax sp.]
MSADEPKKADSSSADTQDDIIFRKPESPDG